MGPLLQFLTMTTPALSVPVTEESWPGQHPLMRLKPLPLSWGPTTLTSVLMTWTPRDSTSSATLPTTAQRTSHGPTGTLENPTTRNGPARTASSSGPTRSSAGMTFFAGRVSKLCANGAHDGAASTTDFVISLFVN